MGTSQSVPELVTAAQANAKMSEDRVSEILKGMSGQNGSDAQREDLRSATVALELVAIDIFTLFEARMQHHFKRGPFSRKLKALLMDAGQTDLADRLHQYYLAINLLKHGKGASYRELLNAPSSFIVVRPTEAVAEDATDDEGQAAAGLVDVNAPGFFDGLCETIIEAYQFLENRQVS